MHLRDSCSLLPALAAVLLFSAPPPALAGWPGSPDINVPACTATGDQMQIQSASDGAGGVILAWVDDRPGAAGIYVQRITAYGTAAWTADGVRIHTPPLGVINVARRLGAGMEEVDLGIVSDGAGGAIVAWKDTVGAGDTDILAQRVGRTGAILWDPAGVPLCRAEGRQLAPVAVPDGEGGAIVAWQDLRGGALTVRAQRVTASGACAWTPDGLLASSANEGYEQPDWTWIYLRATSDGAGGAMLTWASARGIVAQRLDPGGATLWSPTGVAARPHERLEAQPQIASDGSQGAFLAWADYWNGGSGIHAQHVDAAGNVYWGARGETVCDGWYDSWGAHLVPDGQGGCIIVWQDTRPYYCWPCDGSVLYGQRLNAIGNALWASGGVLVSDAFRGSGAQNMRQAPQVAPDGNGGVLVTYALNVSGDPGCSSASLYLQRVAGDGTRAWANDVAMCCLAANWAFPVLVQSETGGAIVAWEDRRNGNGDLYAQRVHADGTFRAPITFADAGAGLPANGSFAWGDYDNDGDLDVLCAETYTYPASVRIYRNDAGSFVDIGAAISGGLNAAWGDFDNDGWLDVLVAGGIYRNHRDGTFSLLTPFPDDFVSCADFDADGDLDVLLIGNSGMPHEIAFAGMYRNDGNGHFTYVDVGFSGGTHGSWGTGAWADYDRDGHLDVLLGSSLFHNNGNKWFLHVLTEFPSYYWGQGAWGDLDNDGFADVAFGGYGVYRGNGDGTFANVAGLPWVNGLFWADFDNDGRSDIIQILDEMPGVSGSIARNEGGGLFTDIGAGLPVAGMGFNPPAVADFDRDGDMDLLLGGTLYRNDGAPANTPPKVPDGPWSEDVSNGYITLQWSPTTDAETPAPALTYNLRIGTTPGGSEIMSPMSDPVSGFRRVVQSGNAGTCTSLTIKVPYSQEHVYWSVQAVDGAYAGSPFSAEHVFGPVPTLPCLYTLDAEPSVVRLVFYAATELPGAVTLYRRDAATDWVALGPLAPDGTGYLRYEDTAVEPGGRYGYRVGVAGAAGQVFGEEVWADVPREALAFALERLSPNPSHDGTVTAQFSLPAGPAARLELVDVRGRRVIEQKIQGPGRFSVSLGRDRRIGSGVYFVRLVQGAQMRVERAVVLQ